MKVITFNANGIRAAARKGFYTWLQLQNADFVCIQETKAQVNQLIPIELYFPDGYYCIYNDALKKGYSGVAIYAKVKPDSIIKDLGFAPSDTEGRYLQFDYPNLSVISLYLPSGTTGEVRQTVKYEFLDFFSKHLKKLSASGREFIICGDFNIAHHKIDLKNWQSNQKNSGFLPKERAWLDEVFGKLGFVDAFRVLNQEAGQYTWWSNRANSWANNVGWRIDYQIITQGLVSHLKDTSIYRDTQFSDHAPLIMTYSGLNHETS